MVQGLFLTQHPNREKVIPMNVKECRNRLRALGYRLSVRSVDYSDLAGTSIPCGKVTNAAGKVLPSVFFGEEHRKEWLPVLQLLSEEVLTPDGKQVRF